MDEREQYANYRGRNRPVGQYNEEGDHHSSYHNKPSHRFDAGNHFEEYEYDEGYPDNDYDSGDQDTFEERPENPSSTTFFDGASNFVINGGDFCSSRGGSYADFEWESEPPRPSPSSSTRRDFFKGSSNFIISGRQHDISPEAPFTYRKPSRPRKKRHPEPGGNGGNAKMDPSKGRRSSQDHRVPKGKVNSGRPKSKSAGLTVPSATLQTNLTRSSVNSRNGSTTVVVPAPDHQTLIEMPIPVQFPLPMNVYPHTGDRFL